MERKSISEYKELANELWDIGWFNPEMVGESIFLVEDFQDAVPLDELKCSTVFFTTDDEEQLKRFKPLFEDTSVAFLLIADKAERNKTSDMMGRLFPEIPLYIPKDSAFGKYNKLRDLLDDGGEKALDNLMMQTVQKPAHGLIDLSEVKPHGAVHGTLSGIQSLDREINGFGDGQLSIWTGTRGSGKSTAIGNILLNTVDQGYNVCAYSGELPAWQFQQWEFLQAAGPDLVKKQINPRTGKEYYIVSDEVKAKINAWWKGHFFLYDNNIANANDADSILDVMNLAYHRHGCKTFLCDNLMTARFSSNDRDFYREQSAFVGRLVEFAKKNNVHVHLVAHPRKAGEGNLIADDVGGSGDITNRADNVISIKRITDPDAGFDAGLTVLKNRDYGATAKIELCFDIPSRRFYENGWNPNWKYSWDDGMREISDDGTMPEGF